MKAIKKYNNDKYNKFIQLNNNNSKQILNLNINKYKFNKIIT